MPPLPTPQINCEDQKISNISNDCLMSIDGANFRIPQTGEAKTGNWFASHKYSFKSALRYEIGVIGGGWYGSRIPTQPDASMTVIFLRRSSATSSSRVSAARLTKDMLAPPTRSSARTIRATQWKTRGCSPAHGIAPQDNQRMLQDLGNTPAHVPPRHQTAR
jgi:hypothetical protein